MTFKLAEPYNPTMNKIKFRFKKECVQCFHFLEIHEELSKDKRRERNTNLRNEFLFYYKLVHLSQ